MNDKTGTTGTTKWRPWPGTALSPPSPAVSKKQSAQNSEANFMRDLDKVTQRKSKPS